jgi:hypothetical protein
MSNIPQEGISWMAMLNLSLSRKENLGLISGFIFTLLSARLPGTIAPLMVNLDWNRV